MVIPKEDEETQHYSDDAHHTTALGLNPVTVSKALAQIVYALPWHDWRFSTVVICQKI